MRYRAGSFVAGQAHDRSRRRRATRRLRAQSRDEKGPVRVAGYRRRPQSLFDSRNAAIWNVLAAHFKRRARRGWQRTCVGGMSRWRKCLARGMHADACTRMHAPIAAFNALCRCAPPHQGFARSTAHAGCKDGGHDTRGLRPYTYIAGRGYGRCVSSLPTRRTRRGSLRPCRGQWSARAHAARWWRRGRSDRPWCSRRAP